MKRRIEPDVIQIEPTYSDEELIQVIFNGKLDEVASQASVRLGLKFLFLRGASDKVKITGFDCPEEPGSDAWYQALHQFILGNIVKTTQVLVSESE